MRLGRNVNRRSVGKSFITQPLIWYEGGSLIDKTAGIYNLTNANATLTTNQNGESNKAWLFNGTNASVYHNFGADPFYSSPGLSYNLWVKILTYTNDKNIITGINASTFAKDNIRTYSAGRRYFQQAFSFFLDSTYSDNNWHFLTMNCRRTSPLTEVYIDGIFITSFNSFEIGSRNGIYLGGLISQSNYANIAIANVYIYNKLLTIQEIQNIKNY